jgi:hypothetical protein
MTTTEGFDGLNFSFADVRTQLKNVIARLARVSSDAAAHVQWRDERQEQSTGTKVTLHTRSVATVGTPELRTRYVPGDVGDPNVPTAGTELKNDIGHQKTFTLQVLVECFDQTVTANFLADQIRDRLYRPWSLGQLRAVNVAVLGVEPTIDLPRTYDKRIVSVVVFDVRLGWGFVDTQEAFDATAGASDVTDADTFIETLVVNRGVPDAIEGRAIATEQTITITETP